MDATDRHGSRRIRIANAPCSWGVLEFDGMAAPATWHRVLDEIAATGYAGTELGDWGFMPVDAARLGDELARRGLELIGAFVPVAFADEASHAGGAATALRAARLLAAVAGESPLIVLSDDNGTDARRTSRAGRIGPEDGLTPERQDVFARGVERVAQQVREETGLRCVVHPHCGGFVEAPWEVESLIARTDPALVGLCLDTGHAVYGGGDPLAVVERHAARVWHVHFKDCDPEVAARARAGSWDYFAAVRNGIFCELGRGAVDFRAVTDALRAREYRGWIVVEQDVLPGMGTPAESARRNREYLRGLGV